MNLARRFAGLFHDSPNYVRDRSNLLSGFTIGTTGLLLNAAVLMLVLPLMLDPNAREIRDISENVEFGQLLAIILLGGASAFATILIPLRLVSVFWGPRIGGYFDQIVLSGISPIRFVIGKATSQNLFLGLVLFLLLPYLVLSLTLGGVDIGFFLAGLVLVWMYCMALALVTIWLSLYFNELVATLLVIAGAGAATGFGCAPLPFQPFVITPFPALVHPIYTSLPYFNGRIQADFLSVFLVCAAGMAVMIGLSLFAIYLGPLFGIIRENSTFGEVVRKGDSRRKRWMRLRLHIQRPSEIAFFYENRSETLRRSEALLRWGVGLFGMVLLLSVAYGTFVYFLVTWVLNSGRWRWTFEFFSTVMVIHGVGLAIAAFLFSHGKNSTLLRLPVLRQRMMEVSRLDTLAFLVFAVVSTVAAVGMPFGFEFAFASGDNTLFPEVMFDGSGRPANLVRNAIEGSLVILLSAFVVYAMHRLVCLHTWVKTVSFLGVVVAYAMLVCALPMFLATAIMEFRTLASFRPLATLLFMASPVSAVVSLFHDIGGYWRQAELSTVPFYVWHGGLLCLTLWLGRRRESKLREAYLAEVNG